MWLSLFGSSRSRILSREGLRAAKRKAKERPRVKVTGGGIQNQEQMESVFTHTPPSPWHDKDNCKSPSPLSPPPSPNGWVIPHWSTQRPQRWTLWWPQFGGYEYMNWYWTVMVIAFCFYHFLIGRLWAEILTATVWQKSVKSWRRYFVDANICDVFCMASRYSAGESPAIKAGRPAATAHLVTARGEVGETSVRYGRSQLLRTLPCQNSKEMLPLMHQHFADA